MKRRDTAMAIVRRLARIKKSYFLTGKAVPYPEREVKTLIDRARVLTRGKGKGRKRG